MGHEHIHAVDARQIDSRDALQFIGKMASLQEVKLQPQQGAVTDYVGGAWVIEPIVEDPSTIIEQALRELGEDPQ